MIGEIINREAITNSMIADMEMIVQCANPYVYAFCNKHGWDIMEFIELIEDERITIIG